MGTRVRHPKHQPRRMFVLGDEDQLLGLGWWEIRRIAEVAHPRAKTRINLLFPIPANDLCFNAVDRCNPRLPGCRAIGNERDHGRVLLLHRQIPRRVAEKEGTILMQMHLGSADADEVWFQFRFWSPRPCRRWRDGRHRVLQHNRIRSLCDNWRKSDRRSGGGGRRCVGGVLCDHPRNEPDNSSSGPCHPDVFHGPRVRLKLLRPKRQA